MPVIFQAGHMSMFFSSKVLRINNWTNKINNNLYNKHAYTAQYIEHIYINSGRYKLGEALINFGVCLGGLHTGGSDPYSFRAALAPPKTIPIPLDRLSPPTKTIPIPVGQPM